MLVAVCCGVGLRHLVLHGLVYNLYSMEAPSSSVFQSSSQSQDDRVLQRVGLSELLLQQFWTKIHQNDPVGHNLHTRLRQGGSTLIPNTQSAAILTGCMALKAHSSAPSCQRAGMLINVGGSCGMQLNDSWVM